MLIDKRKKIIAAFFLSIFSIQLLMPTVALALTSGPSQPEVQKFEPAGVSDMVDLFSGDLKYNIPLLDVGGYPVNLSYQSGTGIEDEASWVGVGWTLNPGAVTRNLRGLPDDFDGSKGLEADVVAKEYSRKPFKKVGGNLVVKPSAFAWEFGAASVKLNVYKDNYYGIGASVGAGLSFSLAENTKTPLTAGLNLDLNSDTREGVDIDPSFSLSQYYDVKDEVCKASLSGGFQFNTRAGLKNVSLEATSNTSKQMSYGAPANLTLSAVHYFGQTYTPSILTNTSNDGFTFSLDGGVSLFGGYVGLGGTGYTYRESILEPVSKAPAFGYLYYQKGRKNENALLDFNREKDGVFLTSAPAIAVPVATQDFFTATGQTGSQQFRPHLNGNYVVFDREHHNNSINTRSGVTVGGGNLFKGGGRLEQTHGGSHSKKWTQGNNYLQVGNPEATATPDPLEEPVYFKQVGELMRTDHSLYNNIGTQTEKVAVGVSSSSSTYASAFDVVKGRNSSRTLSPIKREETDRAPRNYTFSYLTAEQAQKYGVDKTISGEARYNYVPGEKNSYRKGHHISEITVTDQEGKRMVYGIPVYNTLQQEVSFSLDLPKLSNVDPEKAKRSGIVTYNDSDPTKDNRNGRDWLYSKETLPAYTTAHLLTGILSPDYVDVTGNGITDDDLGTAVKFSYKQVTHSEGQYTPYKWRTPYGSKQANYNEGFNSDEKDDKGSYIYGEKELWYLDRIESKTMVAVFETSDREDGFGVLGESGGLNTQVALKKLDRIKLYSKADLLKNPTTATPIKVVHFEYDYSLYPGVPNNKNNTDVVKDYGKLTLKKVYFTFGNSSRGTTHPYEFAYDLRMVKDATPNLPQNLLDAENTDHYTERQVDRWGTYKQSFYNQVDQLGKPLLNNSEFSYALQENSSTLYSVRALVDQMASKWQLNQITTPSGSIITVDYESDDYAFVQNKRAMQMCFIKGVENIGQSEGLVTASKLAVELPCPVADIKEFERVYLQGADGRNLDRVFFKVLTDVDNYSSEDNHKHWEWVHGYAEIDLNNSEVPDSKTVLLALKSVGTYNPIAKAAWQMLRSELPQYAYANYDNSDVGDGQAAIRSILQSLGNFKELFQPFDKRAEKRGFANKLVLGKSMVRLYSPGFKDKKDTDKDYSKTGGGSRVSRIQISDEWAAMAGPSNKTAQYGQSYDYTITDREGNKYSSGVASYEPMIGNEENPFHEPLSFTEKVHWGSDRYHFIERPFCESYFPAASVGYSKVKVTSFGVGENPGEKQEETGYVENEFYTAKDFPTLVDYLPLDQVNYENSLILKLFASTYINRVVTSQGFKIELNDMHGKPKGVKVFNKGGDLISATEYYYSVKDEKAEAKELDNAVDILEKDGTIKKAAVGMDLDFVTDVRESVNESVGSSAGAYTGGMSVPIFVPYFPYAAVNYNSIKRSESYHSISAVKVINRFGILKRTRTIQNGSTLEAENLLWDGATGEVVLSRTQNSFDKFTYVLNYPAYLAYEGMGGAYKNQGAVFTNLHTGTNGDLSSVAGHLFPGDELVALSGPSAKGWVIRAGDGTLRLIDEKGEFLSVNGSFLLLRSGRRNLTLASVGTVVMMNDPREGGKLNVSAAQRVLEAQTLLYKEEWAQPVPQEQYDANAYFYWAINPQYYQGFCKTLLSVNPATGERYIYSFQSDNIALGTIIRKGMQLGNFPAGSNPLADFFLRCDNTEGYLAPNPDEVVYFVEGLIKSADGVFTIPYTEPQGYLKMGPFVIDELTFNNINNAKSFLNNSTEQPAFDSEDVLNACGREVFFLPPAGSCEDLEIPCRFSIRYRAHSEDAGGMQCLSPVDYRINPYKSGLLGNWRPFTSYVYTVSRVQNKGIGDQLGGTDIRNSGYYSLFTPFWLFQSSGLKNGLPSDGDTPADDNRWVWNSKSVYYDQKGNEVESVDALNRYGSALFGYQQSVAVAVAANARQNEIAFDGFEDYGFTLQNSPSVPCAPGRHFDFGTGGSVVSTFAHSGRYSFNLTSSVVVSKAAGSGSVSTAPLLGFDAAGRCVLKRNELAGGFAPVPGKKYLLSMWVNEGDESNPTNKVQKLSVLINGEDKQVSLSPVPVVEGWKHLEVVFEAGADFRLQLNPSGTVYIDDFRIMPFDGQLNSYVYDDVSLRMVAQLDENNFATFYEYDDAGQLVRVKKETEKGIMTLKESRVAFRTRTH